jgi:hypothetical protein
MLDWERREVWKVRSGGGDWSFVRGVEDCRIEG